MPPQRCRYLSDHLAAIPLDTLDPMDFIDLVSVLYQVEGICAYCHQVGTTLSTCFLAQKSRPGPLVCPGYHTPWLWCWYCHTPTWPHGPLAIAAGFVRSAVSSSRLINYSCSCRFMSYKLLKQDGFAKYLHMNSPSPPPPTKAWRHPLETVIVGESSWKGWPPMRWNSRPKGLVSVVGHHYQVL